MTPKPFHPLSLMGTLCLGTAVAASPAPPPSGFSVTGEWSYGSLPSHGSGKATIYSHSPGASATWNPLIRSAGPVRIWIFNPSHPGNDPAAKIEVFHSGNVEARKVDQTKEPPGWVLLGDFNFSGKGDECVRLSAGTRHKNIRAAAMKFEWLGPAADNLWANLIIDDMSIYDPAKFAPKPLRFTDVGGHWAEAEIREVSELGLLKGGSDRRFAPENSVELFEVRDAMARLGAAAPAAAVLVPEKGRPSGARLAELFVGMATATGKNLEWAAAEGDPLRRAVALGLVRETEIGRFGNDVANRGQAAALLVRFRRHILNSGPPTGGRWSLAFHDEFNGNSLDWNVWKSAQGESWGKLLSARFPENATVSDGQLHLVTRKESRGGKDWTSAFVSTKAFRQQYGYWEAGIRYAGAPGLNNAFWTNPDATFEIDINEGHFPHIINSTLHQKGLPSSTTRHLASVDLSLGFHTYAAEWDKDQITFYFDGREIGRKPNAKAHVPGPVMFSTAVFGSWAGPLTDALDGKSMDVDWVRVYRNTEKLQP